MSNTDNSSNNNNNNNNSPAIGGNRLSITASLPPVVQRLENGQRMPVCLIIVGMAGSGKTSLVTQLQINLSEKQQQQRQQQKQQDANKNRDDTTTTTTTTTTRSGAESVVVSTANEPVESLTNKVEQLATTDNKNDGNRNDDDDNNNNEQGDEEEDDDDNELDDIYYCINLDPATIHDCEYDVSIDIRDTVDYKQVMKQHQLGPNGAIMTSLNLFTTKFDQVMNILEKRCYGNSIHPNNNNANNTDTTSTDENTPTPGNGNTIHNDHDNDNYESPIEYIIVDTPGQIEAFTWSASGAIISESLASAFPTVLVYVVDTVRCAASPNTFMSNMLYACSMLYRTRLPLVICFNKIDVISHEFCIDWMKDYEIFQQALDDMSDTSGFYGSLTRSLSLVLDEFYSNFANACGVSSLTGAGIDEFWKTVQKAATQDFALDYVDDLKNRFEEQQVRQQAIERTNMKRYKRDVETTTKQKK